MKSIHEVSVAYGEEYQGTVNIEDFEAGANYVLDEIEKVFAENTNPISPDSHVLYCIRDRIKQLKSNQ